MPADDFWRGRLRYRRSRDMDWSRNMAEEKMTEKSAKVRVLGKDQRPPDIVAQVTTVKSVGTGPRRRRHEHYMD